MAVYAIVWKRDPKKPVNFEDWLLGGAITLFTGEPYTHVALYVKGNTYQDTWYIEKAKIISGATKTTGLPTFAGELVFLKLIQDVDENKLAAFLDGTVSNSRNYSVLKLLSFMFVYPFRKLLKEKNLDPHLKGETCSVYAAIGIHYVATGELDAAELLGWQAPRDFIDSKLFTVVDRSTVL